MATNKTEKLIKELLNFEWQLDRFDGSKLPKGEILHYLGKARKEIQGLNDLVNYWKNKHNQFSMKDLMLIRSEPKGRACKGCNRDISHKHPNAKFHSRQCKDQYWNAVNPRGYGL